MKKNRIFAVLFVLTVMIAMTSCSDSNQSSYDDSGKEKVSAESGAAQMRSNPETDAVVKEGSRRFSSFTFKDAENGIDLEYSLYIPQTVLTWNTVCIYLLITTELKNIRYWYIFRMQPR